MLTTLRVTYDCATLGCSRADVHCSVSRGQLSLRYCTVPGYCVFVRWNGIFWDHSVSTCFLLSCSFCSTAWHYQIYCYGSTRTVTSYCTVQGLNMRLWQVSLACNSWSLIWASGRDLWWGLDISLNCIYFGTCTGFPTGISEVVADQEFP